MVYTPSCSIICGTTFLRSLENFMQIDQRVKEIEYEMLILCVTLFIFAKLMILSTLTSFSYQCIAPRCLEKNELSKNVGESTLT